jgi:ParB family chromosome partitioning protein
MSKLAQQMGEAVHTRRPREQTQSGVAATMLGAMTHEVAAPQMLSVQAIVASPYQRRGRVDETYMETLVESIRDEGLHDPIIVRPLPPAPPREEGCDLITPPPKYELVAGHHRLEAFRRLGRTEIPAFVRHLADIEAARALTSENTNRKNLSHWETYKHMLMLREAGAVRSNADLGRLLNVDRTIIQHIDTFGALPQAAQELLDDHPELVGYNLAKKLKHYCPEHQMIVFDGLVLLSKGKLNQSSVLAWIEEKANPREKKPRKDLELGGGVRLVITSDGARVSGAIDYDALHKLIEANLPQLMKSH